MNLDQRKYEYIHLQAYARAAPLLRGKILSHAQHASRTSPLGSKKKNKNDKKYT